MWQDVVDIMKESLYDKYVDENGCVDFARSGGMSQLKEAKKFLNALNKESELQQKDCFSRTVSDVANLLLSSITILNLLCFEEKPLLHFEQFSFLVTFSLQRKRITFSCKLIVLFSFLTKNTCTFLKFLFEHFWSSINRKIYFLPVWTKTTRT